MDLLRDLGLAVRVLGQELSVGDGPVTVVLFHAVRAGRWFGVVRLRGVLMFVRRRNVNHRVMFGHCSEG